MLAGVATDATDTTDARGRSEAIRNEGFAGAKRFVCRIVAAFFRPIRLSMSYSETKSGMSRRR